MLNIVNAAGLKVIDVVPTSLGDYNCFKNETTKESIGAIVNIGYDETCISIFNKGILTNSKCFPIGEKSVIRDIAFVKNLKFDVAKGVYKKIALANTKLSNKNEFVIAVDNDENKIKLEQFDVSEIAVSRIEEILELVKKQINILTKKQISYIIITGALTELKDFSITLESVLGKNAYLGKLKIIGARDNNYVSAIGVIKYFNNQLKLKNRNFSIFSEDELEEMNNLGKESSDNKNSLVNKVFGYFFDS
jgi:cell division ATPase FtsA